MTYDHDNLRTHSEEVCQDTVHNPCTNQNECGNESTGVDAELAKLQQEIKALTARIPAIFEEIASIAVAAQVSMEISDHYEYFVESIQHQIEVLERLEEDIMALSAKVKQATQKPCCETAISEAHAYCPECGRKLDTDGKICGNCNAHNAQKNDYCTNCGNKFTVIDPNKCHNCHEAYPTDIQVKFCPNCGARRENL